MNAHRPRRTAPALPILAIVATLATVVLHACSPPPSSGVAPDAPATRATTSRAATPRDDFCVGVTNFAKVSPALWRGAQPTAEGFRNLEAAGAKTVVNLRSDHDDAALLEGTRLESIAIRMRPWDLDEDEIVAFLRVAQDPARQPVFVHCSQGRDRTGYCIAAWRMVVEGWSADEAIAEMEAFHFNAVWIGNRSALRELDVARMRKRLASYLDASGGR
jgi:protein tyrosine phosphatase (PTP) superfamily phosphohydrolase (DUF442 family)